MVHQTGAETTVLAADTPCIECDYDLGGLSPDGVCPECAVPIATTVRGGLLRFSDPAYIRRLKNGAAMAFFGSLGGLVISLVSAVFETTVAEGSLAIALVSSALALLMGLVLVVGLWWLTTRDPHANPRNMLTPSRLCVRIGLIVTISLAVLGIVATIGSTYVQDDRLFDLLSAASLMLIAGATLSNFMMIIITAWHTRALSRRLPDAVLYRRAGIVMRMMAIAVVLSFAAVLTAIAVGMVGAMMFSAAVLLLLVALIFFLLTLERTRASLSRTLRDMTTVPAPAQA